MPSVSLSAVVGVVELAKQRAVVLVGTKLGLLGYSSNGNGNGLGSGLGSGSGLAAALNLNLRTCRSSCESRRPKARTKRLVRVRRVCIDTYNVGLSNSLIGRLLREMRDLLRPFEEQQQQRRTMSKNVW
jgi:hypothetical protein